MQPFRFGVLALVLLWAAGASAGTYSFSFSPAYCTVGSTAPTATTVGSGVKSKFAYQFNQSATDVTLYCMVQFPYAATTASLSVTPTFEVTSPGAGGNICWKAKYEVSRAGVAWGDNPTSSTYVATAASAAIGTTGSVDIQTTITGVLAYDTLTGATCDPANCQGNHGILTLARQAQGSCTGESAQPAKLTHINVTATTP